MATFIVGCDEEADYALDDITCTYESPCVIETIDVTLQGDKYFRSYLSDNCIVTVNDVDMDNYAYMLDVDYNTYLSNSGTWEDHIYDIDFNSLWELNIKANVQDEVRIVVTCN